MTLKRSFIAVILSVFVGTSAYVSQSTKPLSHGELYKQAERQEKEKNFTASYQSIKEAIKLKGSKPEKKYEDLRDRVGRQLADTEAKKGEDACKASDLVLCEEQLKKAKDFYPPLTPDTQKLQSTYDRQLTELKANYAGIIQLANTDPDRALAEITTLRKFIVHLPDIPTKTEQIRAQAVASHQSAGSAALAARKWDEANQHFNRVLELSPNDAKATAGLKDTARLRDAYGTEREALAALDAKNYRSSLTLFDQAIAAAPEVGEFKQKKQLAVDGWTAALIDGLENLMSDQTSREKTRDAYIRIDDLRSLNSSHQSVKDLGEQIRQNFGGTLLDRSTELAGLQDFSRTGTAAISKARAAELLPAGTIKIEDLKDVFENFNKRRATQLLISSTDLSGADPVFIQTATLRAKSAAENASLPDVRVRNLADYEKQPEEDSILRGVLVDGKSSTVLLTVAVTKYSNFKKQGDAKRVKSQFNGPLENVPNPRYKELQAEIASINRDLADEKKKKDWERLKVELGVKTGQLTNGTVKEYNSETKKVDYDYLEVSWAQDISIEVSLTLKDYFTQTTISAPAPIVVTRHIPDVEISGVHKDDSQGLQDRKPTRISDDALTEARNQVLERITSLTAEILPNYTRRFFVEGDAAKTTEPERAVEDFISHWAFFRGKLEKKELDTISDFVREHTGYSLVADGPRLLQRSLVTTATVDRR